MAKNDFLIREYIQHLRSIRKVPVKSRGWHQIHLEEGLRRSGLGSVDDVDIEIIYSFEKRDEALTHKDVNVVIHDLNLAFTLQFYNQIFAGQVSPFWKETILELATSYFNKGDNAAGEKLVALWLFVSDMEKQGTDVFRSWLEGKINTEMENWNQVRQYQELFVESHEVIHAFLSKEDTLRLKLRSLLLDIVTNELPQVPSFEIMMFPPNFYPEIHQTLRAELSKIIPAWRKVRDLISTNDDLLDEVICDVLGTGIVFLGSLDDAIDSLSLAEAVINTFSSLILDSEMKIAMGQDIANLKMLADRKYFLAGFMMMPSALEKMVNLRFSDLSASHYNIDISPISALLLGLEKWDNSYHTLTTVVADFLERIKKFIVLMQRKEYNRELLHKLCKKENFIIMSQFGTGDDSERNGFAQLQKVHSIVEKYPTEFIKIGTTILHSFNEAFDLLES